MSGYLEVEGLTVEFVVEDSVFARARGQKPRMLTAVDDVSFEVPRGESLGIVGESGCGKSTVARALVGLVAPSAGSIRFESRPLTIKRSRTQRRQIQMVFQDPGSSLNPTMTVGAMLTELLKVHDMVPEGQLESRCHELLELVELPVSLLSVRPRRLSGGQRQRIGIARALALEPQVLIADESVAALDVSVQASVLNLLSDLRDELGLTLLFISHDLAVIRHLARRVLVMYLGSLVEDRPVAELFDDPRHPYTRALVASAPHLTRAGTGQIPIVGEPPSPLELPTGCTFHPRCPLADDVCRTHVPTLETGRSGRLACHHSALPQQIPE